MSATMDPYRVLGLEPGASQAEVKRAYRRLAKAFHPDAAGEAALPRFLELQDAYELLTGTKVRTVRTQGSPPASPGAAPGAAGRGPSHDGPAGAEGFREPWRADPARARAAREQARARRPWGGGPTWTGSGPNRTGAGPSAAGGTAPGGGRRPRTGASDRGPSDAAASGGNRGGAGATHGAASEGSARSTGRRRASRKATLGSTSYDEARDPADRSWSGASWYGPTTGEYWIVNPREYADPRKHGPGYTSRGRTEAGDDTSTPPPAAPVASPPSAGAPVGRSRVDARPGSASDPARPAAGETTSTGLASGTGESSGPRAAHEATMRSRASSAAPSIGVPLPESLAEPWRRLGLTLLAWPPLGLAAAAAIGQATGCSSYSAACDGTDRLLPWLAQAIVLAVLFASPWLARLLGGGSIAALVALVPGVGIITALGGARSAEGGPVLAGWLAMAWLAGVAIGGRRLLGHPRGEPAGPPAGERG